MGYFYALYKRVDLLKFFCFIILVDVAYFLKNYDLYTVAFAFEEKFGG